jgi:hypothetical protein
MRARRGDNLAAGLTEICSPPAEKLADLAGRIATQDAVISAFPFRGISSATRFPMR